MKVNFLSPSAYGKKVLLITDWEAGLNVIYFSDFISVLLLVKSRSYSLKCCSVITEQEYVTFIFIIFLFRNIEIDRDFAIWMLSEFSTKHPQLAIAYAK